MIIKDCYVSHNGISCFTDINNLVNIKEFNLNKKFIYSDWKNSLFFYISARCIEMIVKDFINNKNFLLDNDNSNEIITSIMFT